MIKYKEKKIEENAGEEKNRKNNRLAFFEQLKNKVYIQCLEPNIFNYNVDVLFYKIKDPNKTSVFS